MIHYLAIIEDDGTSAIGVWFPDLPGCFSAGDTLDEAMANAPEALALYAQARAEGGLAMPRARYLAELKTDPDTAADLAAHIVALVPFAPGAATIAA